MSWTLLPVEEQEQRRLAPYALTSAISRGRRYPEPKHPFRSDYQRDRDRVLHCRPFRRLEYKTQVFLNHAGDHYRTRLTHTIEMAAIARTVARVLGLNEDLAETISLAHDLGHTPFGHAGERELNTLMKDFGGFDHNAQALKIVDHLERRYPDYDGLNLTWETRSGLIKRRDGVSPCLDDGPLPPMPSLEAQVADMADDLTYYGHDTDDGLESGLISEKDLDPLAIWREAAELSLARGLKPGDPRFRPYTVRCLIDNMVGDLVRHTHRRLSEYRITTSDEAQKLNVPLVRFSPEFEEKTQALRRFLYDRVYFHPDIQQVNDDATRKMAFLFSYYSERPEAMGRSARNQSRQDAPRAVADYIAGMTDRFAIQEYHRRAAKKASP